MLRELIKTKLLDIIGITLIVLTVVLGGYDIWKKSRETQQLKAKQPPMTEMERDETRAMHKYHGIIVSYVDEDGKEWFMRNGERCWIVKK